MRRRRSKISRKEAISLTWAWHSINLRPIRISRMRLTISTLAALRSKKRARKMISSISILAMRRRLFRSRRTRPTATISSTCWMTSAGHRRNLQRSQMRAVTIKMISLRIWEVVDLRQPRMSLLRLDLILASHHLPNNSSSQSEQLEQVRAAQTLSLHHHKTRCSQQPTKRTQCHRSHLKNNNNNSSKRSKDSSPTYNSCKAISQISSSSKTCSWVEAWAINSALILDKWVAAWVVAWAVA